MSPFTAPPQISFNLKRSAVAAQQLQAALADGGPPAASAAFAALNKLNAVCDSAVSAVNAANFGPFTNEGSCTFDCSTKKAYWDWTTDYTNWARQTLGQLILGMEFLGPFTNAFAPAQQWATSGLPGYGSKITAAINDIRQIDAVIKSTGTETPAQQQALAADFGTALSQVNSSLGEANAALQSLAGFLSRIVGRSISPQPYQTQVDNWITTDMNNSVAKAPCGADDMRSQFVAMKSAVDASFVSLQTPFNNVNSQYNAAVGAGDVVAGVFLNIQTKSQLVTDFLTKAQNVSPTSPLRGPYLNIAASDWADLVTYSQTQLSH